jgi:ribosome-associated heat shock protein Hsp15
MIRFDKFIWLVRITKTRKDAVDAINNGRIRLNSQEVKPSKDIKATDLIQVKKHNATFSYVILQIPDRRLGPKLVPEFLQDITPEDEKIKLQEYQDAQKEYRQFGIGKPTKKQRRDLANLKL